MPTLEVQDYEHFSYDEKLLTLDEATKKARDLRRNDTANFYRVEQVSENGTDFTVKKVPMASVYADFIARVTKLVGRNRSRLRH